MRVKSTILVLLVIFVGVFSFPLISSVAASSMIWSKTFGGDDMDACTSMLMTTDGGFALFGFAHSFGTDAWLVKTNADGNMEWNKTIEYAASFIQTMDGGFAFVGTNASTVEGYIPVGRLPDGFWSYVWLAKTDEYGNMEWNQTYDGETGSYHGSSFVQTNDGGYVLMANSFSSIGDYDDVLLIKTDSYGNREWSKLYDYSEHESGSGLVQTKDGGFVLVSQTHSLGEMPDFWFTKTDESGNVEWNITYVDTRMVGVSSLLQLSDESFVLAGCTDVYGNGGVDFYLTKTDDSGSIEWIQTYGTDNDELSYPSLVQASDGGFALAGYTVTSNDHLLADFLLVKTDKRGNMLWNQTYPGQAVLGYPSLIQTVDGGFVLSGAIGSWETGDYDFWLIKTDVYNNPEFPSWIPILILVAGFFAVTVLLIVYKNGFKQKVEN